jgi:hypothetical protein
MTPHKVELPIPVDLITAGDSHSVAASSKLGYVYFWGSYRSEVRGSFYGPVHLPKRVDD